MKGYLGVTALFLAVTVLPAQEPSFREETFHGRHAYVLETARVRVSALRGAGHLAEIRLKSSDPKVSVNPMRVPHFPTIEPWEYDAAKHDQVYGGGTARILQAGYMGHLLNFPTFGGPSDAEARAGLGNHGEALSVEWRKDAATAGADGVRLVYSGHLPSTQYNVGRTLDLPADESVLYIEEWVENLLAFDRPAHWVQHATFGPPFVEPARTYSICQRPRVRCAAATAPRRCSRPGRFSGPKAPRTTARRSVCARCKRGPIPAPTTLC